MGEFTAEIPSWAVCRTGLSTSQQLELAKLTAADGLLQMWPMLLLN